MRIALVHDWLTNLAGAERVLIALHQLYPEAPIYTSVYNPEVFPQLAGADVRTSFLQRLPLARTKHQAFPILRTIAFEGFDLSDYDVVLSSSHAECKGVLTGPETLHICYCYTPIRYYWSGYAHYLAHPRFGLLNPVVKAVMPWMTSYMRVWDRCAADRVDIFIGISEYIAERIKKYYRRDAAVIYPPVNTSWLSPGERHEDFFLMVGRLVPYKRADLVVDVFNELGWPLKIVGTGSEMKALQARARPNVEFLGHVPDGKLKDYYATCKAFVFPQEEDFGITPLEAMAAGRPVIAYRKGGATETVVDGETGVFFDEQTPEALKTALLAFDPDKFDVQKLRQHAEAFDEELFKQRMHDFVEAAWEAFRSRNGHGHMATKILEAVEPL